MDLRRQPIIFRRITVDGPEANSFRFDGSPLDLRRHGRRRSGPMSRRMVATGLSSDKGRAGD